MANTIILKNSGTAASAPATLTFGEVAINYADGKLFYKNSSGTIVGAKLVTNITGTANQISVSETANSFTISLPSTVYITSLFVDNVEIETSGATPNQVLKFDGTKFAPATDAPATFNDISDVVITNPASGELLEFDGTNWVNDVRPSSEPIGHENINDSSIAFNESTRTFSIYPKVSSYTVWCAGKRFIKTSLETVTLPNISNLYYIYFNSSGVLSYKTSYFTWDQDTPTSYIYWNASHSKAYFFADERHGVTLDWATHEYLHRTRGAVIAGGFGINHYTTTGSGSLNSDAQLDIASGTFFDEDLQVDITHSDTPTLNTWQQILEDGAELPVFYLDGTEWIRDNPTKFPLKQGTLRARYNIRTNGSWSTSDLGNNKFGISWIVATNNLNYPILAILGQNQYNTIGEAEEIDWSDLDLSDFPIFEFRVLYKIIYQTSTSYTNTPHAKFVGITDLRRISASGGDIPSVPVNDHGLMTGLDDDDHLQYIHISDDRGTITANIETNGNITADKFFNGGFTELTTAFASLSTVTAGQNIDISSGKCIKYLILAENDSARESTEILTVNKLSSVSHIEYGKVSTSGNDLATYDVVLSSGNIHLNVTPHYVDTSFTIFKTIIL